LGISVICLIFKETEALYGFIFGGLLVAIFIQVSGGIYKKSAETGFDLMGRIDAGLIDDNSKRSVVIAKNIGRTNIFGSGLFNNYVDAVICAIALGVLGLTAEFERLFYLPFILFALLIVLAIAGSVFIRIKTNRVLSKKILNQGIFGLVFLVIIFSFLAIRFIAGDFLLFFAFLTGLVFAICLGFIIKFFTSYKYKPTQKLAISAQNGLVINIFKGFSLGVEGAVALVFIILLMVFIAYLFGGVYGIAIATLGVLSYFLISNIITSYGLMGSGGKDIVKLSDLGGETKIRIEKISIFGGEPVIIKEGLALSLSFLTSLVLFFNFGLIADLKFINIFHPKTIIGAFIGCLIPLLFSSFFLSLMAKTATKIVQEARRQFKKSDSASAIETKPDYCRCVIYGTKSMPKDTVLPFVFVIIVPILTGLLIGKEALGGMLIGSIIA
jgi:K(+)-stimulated pyrophosphate-energized sodium pump